MRLFLLVMTLGMLVLLTGFVPLSKPPVPTVLQLVLASECGGFSRELIKKGSSFGFDIRKGMEDRSQKHSREEVWRLEGVVTCQLRQPGVKTVFGWVGKKSPLQTALVEGNFTLIRPGGSLKDQEHLVLDVTSSEEWSSPSEMIDTLSKDLLTNLQQIVDEKTPYRKKPHHQWEALLK